MDKKTRLPRVGRLHTIGNVASEIGKVYRRVARGELESADGQRRTAILLGLRQCLEESEIVQGIQELKAELRSKRTVINLQPPRLPTYVQALPEEEIH